MRARTALLTLLALPLVAGATPASAGDVTVPGCYGAADAVVCNPTVTYWDPPGIEPYVETVPVCAVACYDVPVTLVRVGPSTTFQLCVSWTDRAGDPSETCYDDWSDPIAQPLVRLQEQGGCYTLWVRDTAVPLFCYNPPPL